MAPGSLFYLLRQGAVDLSQGICSSCLTGRSLGLMVNLLITLDGFCFWAIMR
jgi:hypothetical protein